MKQRIITSVIALSLLTTMPAWGQTAVIKRTLATEKASKGKARQHGNGIVVLMTEVVI